MRYVLDTNIISLLLREHAALGAVVRESIADGNVMVLSSVVEYEVRRGLRHRDATGHLRRFERLIRSFAAETLDRASWERAAELWAHSWRSGQPVDEMDILIAAHAITLDATLITANERHFRLFEPLGLRLENWTQP